MEAIVIIQIIDLVDFFCWDQLVLELYTSSTTKSDSVLNTDSEYPGKMPFVPVGGTGTVPHYLRHHFPEAPGDRRPGIGDGCRMWFVNSWALGWSCDI